MKLHNKPREKDRAIHVTIEDEMLRVQLQDGRIISTPLEWYPSLFHATPEQRAHVELSLSGIYWPDLDEDLSIAGMLRGVRPPQPKQKVSKEN